MTHVALINPNTDADATRRMVQVAETAAAPLGLDILGITATFGSKLITNEAELALAADAVEALLPSLRQVNGVLVSAFGDPGLDRLRVRFPHPAVGIGESALIEAAAEGRRFAVVTTTPALVGSIERAVGRLGLLGAFAGVALTRGDAAAVMSDENRLFRELHAAISALVNAGGVEAIVIGGGPLAEAGRRLAATWPLAIVEPVPTAVRRLARLLTLHDPEPQR